MKIVKKGEAKLFKGSETCDVFEYQMGYKDIDGVVVKLSGRYPGKGAAVNEICRELGYVIEGHGLLSIDGKELLLNEGDVVCIDPGEKFYWEGIMTLFLPCAPAWYPDQHKFVE